MTFHRLLLIAFVLAAPIAANGAEPFNLIPQQVAAVTRLAPQPEITEQSKRLLQAMKLPTDDVDQAAFGTRAQFCRIGWESFIGQIDPDAPIYRIVTVARDKNFKLITPQAWVFKALDARALRAAIVGADPNQEIDVKKWRGGFERLSNGNPFEDDDPLIATRGEWTIVADDVGAASAFILEKNAATLETLEPRALELLTRGQASTWINVEFTWTSIGLEASLFKTFLLAQMPEIPEQLAGGKEAAKEWRKRIEKGFASVYTAADEIEWFAGAVHVSEAGVEADSFLKVPASTSLGKAIGGFTPKPFDDLAALPTGAPIYLGSSFAPGEWDAGTLLTLLGGADALEPRVAAACEALRAAKIESTVWAFWLPTNTRTGFETVQIQTAQYPEKLTAANRALAGDSEVELSMRGASLQLQLTPNAEKYRDHSIDRLRVKVQGALLGDSQNIAAAKAALDHLFGGESYDARTTVVGKRAIQTSGNSLQTMRKAIDAAGGQVADAQAAAAMKQTTAKLSPNANFVLLVDLGRLAIDAEKAIKSSPLASTFNFQSAIDVDSPRPVSLSGLSVAFDPSGVRTKLFVPVEQPLVLLSIFGPAE